MVPPVDRIGKRYGRLVVLSRGPNRQGANGRFHVTWRCRCDCGNEHTTTGHVLHSGSGRSCGCLLREAAQARGAHTHGMTDTPTYSSWKSMKQRCLNPNTKAWEHYGGRGIGIFEPWLSFERFMADMGERPEGSTLDRIDVNGDYEPDNCRWATWDQQGNNRRMASPSTVRRYLSSLPITDQLALANEVLTLHGT